MSIATIRLRMIVDTVAKADETSGTISNPGRFV
jgi:hypothetical protein